MKKFVKILSLVLCAIMLMSVIPSALAVNEDVTGTVLCYTSMYQFVIDMMDAKLKEEFPNLTPGNGESFFFYGGTGTLQNKLAGERETGTLGCDMMLVADPSYCLELKEDGWLHSFEFENADQLRFPYDEEGYWYPVRVSNMVLAYNPELKSPEELPKTFKEFAEDPALKSALKNLWETVRYSDPMGNDAVADLDLEIKGALNELRILCEDDTAEAVKCCKRIERLFMERNSLLKATK